MWKIYIGKVEVGHCYELQDVTIRSFEDQKYLSTSSKCVIQDCDDIGEVSEDIENLVNLNSLTVTETKPKKVNEMKVTVLTG